MSKGKTPGKSTTKTKAPAKRANTKRDWSETIKKALQKKGPQPRWPGSGDAWKRKPKTP